MRLKKEDREGKEHVGHWWFGESLIDKVHRHMKFGWNLGSIEWERMAPPRQNPDGSDYTSEQRNAWWHKTLTDGIVRYINEEVKQSLESNTGWRQKSAKGDIHLLKTVIAFRDKYPQVDCIGVTVQSYVVPKHVRVYTKGEDLPMSIAYSKRIWPFDTKIILNALGGLSTALKEVNKQLDEEQRLRSVKYNKNRIKYATKDLATAQKQIDAFDAEKNAADTEVIQNWLKTMPDCLDNYNMEREALLEVRMQVRVYEQAVKDKQRHEKEIVDAKAWLAENGGEEE